MDIERSPEYALLLAQADHSNEFITYTHRRAELLEEIPRYHAMPEMIHRTDLFTHVTRVGTLAGIAGHIAQSAGVPVDFLAVSHMALIHDDPEIITGDIPTPTKMAMSKEEKARLEEAEKRAIQRLSYVLMPDDFREVYLERYREISTKQTNEAQIVDIADKWDGVCEAIHEVRCGNEAFLEPVKNYRERVIPNLHRHQLWDTIGNSPAVMLSHIPTVEEVNALSRLSPDMYDPKDPSTFWQQVLSPDTPPFYQKWVSASLINMHKKGTALFPGWKEEIGNQDIRIISPIAAAVYKGVPLKIS